MKLSVSQTEATKGNDTAKPVKFKVGQAVIVDGQYDGEILSVEIEADKSLAHQNWYGVETDFGGPIHIKTSLPEDRIETV